MSDIAQSVDCGTAYCIAGWAEHLMRLDGKNLSRKGRFVGQVALGLRSDEKTMRLILMSRWPARFQGIDDGSKKAAKRAVARIDHFIATEGRE